MISTLEKWWVCPAAKEHEDIILGGGKVRSTPWLNNKAIGRGGSGRGESEGVAVWHGGVMESERIVGIVDIQHTVSSRRNVKHKHAIHAVEEITEAWVTTARMEAERIVYRDVATVGTACACDNRNSIVIVTGHC